MILIRECADAPTSEDELLRDAIDELLANEMPSLASAVNRARIKLLGKTELTATRVTMQEVQPDA